MKRLQSWHEDHPGNGGWLSIGNFDGVHLGHRAIITELVRRAQADGVPSIVLTFEPHPLLLLNPQRHPPRLTTPDQRAHQLDQLGVDVLLEYPTDLAFLQLTAGEFFEQIVEQQLRVKGLVEGPNFFYGRHRTGSIHTLQADCARTGRTLVIVDPAMVGDEMVSSSRIRSAISHGDIALGNSMLGRPYRVTGVVQEGARRGRTLGFPTANLPQADTLLPGDGVYAGTAFVAGKSCLAAIHSGPNPTFAEGARKLEVHLLDFQGDLYGQRLEVQIEQRLRGLTRFDSMDQLKAQIQDDVAAVRRLAASA